MDDYMNDNVDDNNLIVWTADRANDILKVAYELQTLCKTSRGCYGCPFRTDNSSCIFTSKPAYPWEWNIQEKTVYTVKIPDT